jgi:Na+/H+ antiporter NhaC
MLVYIFVTQRILEALTLVSIMGFIMADGVTEENVLSSFSNTLLEIMMSEDIAWLFIVCGLMGSIISLIERAGGAVAFANWVSKFTKSRKAALLWTWVLGLFLFVDDYLNSLTLGSCMTPVTDRYKVSREYLSYVVSSTAAPVCVLVPITTWSVFCGKLLESNGWAPAGEGLAYFIKTIPYNYYGWAATFIVPLVIIGIVPLFGPMKKAEQRVADGGPLAPPDSEKIDIRGGIRMEIPDKPNIWNFAIPMIVLVAATIIFDFDMQIGVLVTMAYMFVAYMVQNIMSAEEFSDVALQGIKNMIMPLMLMVLAFLFAEVNELIGFTTYVIDSCTKVMTPELMPVILFVVLALTQIINGTNWGMYIIALPIVIPLAAQIGGSTELAVAAVLSAGVLGSHVCFFSDCTILTSSATGCNNFRHALTQMPLGLFAGLIASIGFLIAGYVVG